MECIKAYNRFSKRKIERSFQFKNKLHFFLVLASLSVECLSYVFSQRDDIGDLINDFYDEDSPTFLPAIALAKQYNDYLNEEVFERVESDLEMLRVMSYEDEYSE